MAGFKNRILVNFSTKNVQHRLELLEKNSDTNLNKNRFLERKKNFSKVCLANSFLQILAFRQRTAFALLIFK